MLCAFKGRCDHCGHDHGNPFNFDLMKSTADKISTLESHNRDLLAANHVLMEALQELTVHNHKLCLRQSNPMAFCPCKYCAIDRGKSALFINPGDVTLVEYAEMYNFGDGNAGINYKNDLRKGDIIDGTKLYTIQTKSNT